jgi:hypothetical protein
MINDGLVYLKASQDDDDHKGNMKQCNIVIMMAS